MPPVTNCASYIDIEAQFVTVKGIKCPSTTPSFDKLTCACGILSVPDGTGWRGQDGSAQGLKRPTGTEVPADHEGGGTPPSVQHGGDMLSRLFGG